MVAMKFKNNAIYKVALVTKGRKTGKKHSVFLRAVTYDDKIYVSRRDPNSDWLKNALAHSRVIVEYNGQSFEGSARVVSDKEVERRISQLKYPDDRANESRIILEILLNEKLMNWFWYSIFCFYIVSDLMVFSIKLIPTPFLNTYKIAVTNPEF